MSAPVPGFYDDPHLPGTLRWWDGRQWTEQTRPLPPAAPGRPSLGPGWAGVALAVQVALLLIAAFAVYVLITNRYVLDVYRRLAEDPTSVPEPEARRADQLALSHLVELPLILVCGVLFIIWLYRAHRSDRMEPQVLQHKSGWAIGGWFVPILNLWRPYQMVTDVRRGASGSSTPVSYPVQAAWWAAFVAWTVLDRIVGRLYLSAERTPEDDFGRYVDRYGTAVAWDQARSLAEIIAAVLAVVMVRQTTTWVLARSDRPAPG